MDSTSLVRFILARIGCCLFVIALVGCGSDTTPVQTSPDAIDQFLEENPDEAYSSDGMVAEMEEDDGEG